MACSRRRNLAKWVRAEAAGLTLPSLRSVELRRVPWQLGPLHRESGQRASQGCESGSLGILETLVGVPWAVDVSELAHMNQARPS